jgi:endonuclease/exonuclease/phosphatase (EEP) superfamily protein YafD
MAPGVGGSNVRTSVVRAVVVSVATGLLVSAVGLSPAAVADDGTGVVPPPQKIVPGLVLEKAPEPKPQPAPLRGAARLREKVELPTSLDLRMVQANITSQQSEAAFAADLTRALATQPDFVTLNEAVRPDALLAREGYSFHRGYDSRWTMETTVMWREDRWDVLSTGTRYLHQRGGTWGTRAVNWVVLQEATTDKVVSVVSAHPSPEGPSSHGLLPVYMGGLSALVRELSVNGPVFVGGDLNAHYTSGRFPRPALASAGLTPTYDVFGMPVGGTGDHGGATIDYLIYQPGAGVTATSQSKVELASDHDAVIGTFTWSW